MITQAKLTVVLPSLNVGPYIRECIESVVNQTLKEIEIFCVDAGSTDGTLEILREYAARDERIVLIHSDRKSYGYQINEGLRAAKGEYFAIVDTDDCIKPEMYATLCPIADQYQLDVIKADFYLFAGDGAKREFTYREQMKDPALYQQVLDPRESFEPFNAPTYSWTGIYRTSFLREHEIYHNETPGASYQDAGFWFQVFANARRVMFFPKPFYMYRQDNPGSSFKSKEKVYCICEEFDFIRDKLRNEPAVEKRYASWAACSRYKHSIWTANRISSEYKLDFLCRFAADFKKIEADGELDRALFSDDEWAKLRQIMEDPEGVYLTQYLDPADAKAVARLTPEQRLSLVKMQLNAATDELSALRASWSYRIGRAITWLPRKARGGVRCLRENGLDYTLHRVKEKLKGK